VSAARAVADWLESTRTTGGYGGPIAHWWRDCLVDCRAGLDWRYEGIVTGYLALHAAAPDAEWLARARRAGDDLVAGQRANGHFERSHFELNPGIGGTPHEAGAAIALLRLAGTSGTADRARYLAAARTALDAQVARQWDPEAARLADPPGRDSFVPNKACTLVEALLFLAELTGDEAPVQRYAVPTAEAVLALQLRRRGDRLDGAIAQNSIRGETVRKYFPYYVARCLPALLGIARATGQERFAEAALAAGRFVARCREPDGGFPQVLYEDGRQSRFPRWVAACGDMLRTLEPLRALGLDWDPAPTRAWLLGGLLPTGGVMTAHGFAGQGTGRLTQDALPEARDLLSVAGWADKAFRYLAEHDAPFRASGRLEAACTFEGRRLTMVAEGGSVELIEGGRSVYRWRPGDDFAEAAPWLAVR